MSPNKSYQVTLNGKEVKFTISSLQGRAQSSTKVEVATTEKGTVLLRRIQYGADGERNDVYTSCTDLKDAVSKLDPSKTEEKAVIDQLTEILNAPPPPTEI